MAGREEGEIKAKYKKRATVLVNTLQCWLFLFSPECTCSPTITSEAQKVSETSGFMSGVMPRKCDIVMQKYSERKKWSGR